MTKGEYRVGISFNPGGNPQVDGIKQITASLINELDEFMEMHTENPEVCRCAAIAQTKYEEAAMWAVKAVTKPQEI